MATKLRLIAQSRAEAERIRHYLRWRLGDDVLLEAPRPGVKGDMLVYGLLDPQSSSADCELDRLPVFDEVPR
jgi:hypothetical protein